MKNVIVKVMKYAVHLALAAAVAMASSSKICAAHAGHEPAPVVPLASEPPARLYADAPLSEQLARGLVVIQYRFENLRIVPVFGPNAVDVSPRIGHMHVTVDDAPWHWADASGEPLIIQGLLPGPHRVLIELADPTHKVMDSQTVDFEIPQGGLHHLPSTPVIRRQGSTQ
jgi:hypothetical protein